MGYSLEPFPLADRTYSNNVFLLTEDGVNPIKEFYQKSRDAVAARKIAAAIGSVSERGIDASRQTKLLRKLDAMRSNLEEALESRSNDEQIVR